MQTLIQVYCTKGTSLRERIGSDARMFKHHLTVSREHQPGRSPGWMKVHSATGHPGAINVVWEPGINLLSCRVVTRGGTRPDRIVSDFLAYLFARHRRRVQSIVIFPR